MLTFKPANECKQYEGRAIFFKYYKNNKIFKAITINYYICLQHFVNQHCSADPSIISISFFILDLFCT